MVRELGKMRTLDGRRLDIAITTNGHLLAELAQPLADAGLSRVTVSMDAVEPQHFARITRVPNGYARVLAGLRAAQGAGDPCTSGCGAGDNFGIGERRGGHREPAVCLRARRP